MVDELTPEEVAEKMRAGSPKLVLLDVREAWERELAVIDPSVHIPMGQISTRAKELPQDLLIVVYCHGGTRSAMIAGYLENHGFTQVANLSGGIDSWSTDVDPNVPRYS